MDIWFIAKSELLASPSSESVTSIYVFQRDGCNQLRSRVLSLRHSNKPLFPYTRSDINPGVSVILVFVRPSVHLESERCGTKTFLFFQKLFVFNSSLEFSNFDMYDNILFCLIIQPDIQACRFRTNPHSII